MGQGSQANDNLAFQMQKITRGGGGSSRETRPVRRDCENHNGRTIEKEATKISIMPSDAMAEP